MKKPFKPVTITLILLLLVTASLHSQTTYDLPSGKSLLVINQLPETFRQHFNNKVLVDRLGDLPRNTKIQPLPFTVVSLEHYS